MKTLQLASIFLAVMLLAACASNRPQRGSVADMSNSRWALSDITGFKMNTDRRPTLQLMAGTEVSGFSGCNSYSGSLRVDAATINVDRLAGTKRVCPSAAMEFEQAYRNALTGATSWNIERNTLRLLDQNGTTLLKFRRMGSLVGSNI